MPHAPWLRLAGRIAGRPLDNIREAIILCLEIRREDRLPSVTETLEIIAREIKECLKDRADEGLPLTIETREIEVEVEVAV